MEVVADVPIFNSVGNFGLDVGPVCSLMGDA